MLVLCFYIGTFYLLNYIAVLTVLLSLPWLVNSGVVCIMVGMGACWNIFELKLWILENKF